MTLRDRRNLAGFSQADVARALEVNQSSVSFWERGKNRPIRKYRRKLAELYKCSIDEIGAAFDESLAASGTVKRDDA